MARSLMVIFLPRLEYRIRDPKWRLNEIARARHLAGGSPALLLFNCAPLLARDFSLPSLCVIRLTMPPTCYLLDETSLASWDFTRS